MCNKMAVDSITSSACVSSDAGIVSPIVFAVQLLMTNSNCVARHMPYLS